MLRCCPHCLLNVISCCEEPEPACGDVELTERNATELNLEFKFDVVRSGGVVVVPPVTTHTHNSLLSSISIHQQQPLRFYLPTSRAHTHTIHFIVAAFFAILILWWHRVILDTWHRRAEWDKQYVNISFTNSLCLFSILMIERSPCFTRLAACVMNWALNKTDVDVLHQWIDRRMDRYLGLSVSQSSLTHEQRILVCV